MVHIRIPKKFDHLLDLPFQLTLSLSLSLTFAKQLLYSSYRFRRLPQIALSLNFLARFSDITLNQSKICRAKIVLLAFVTLLSFFSLPIHCDSVFQRSLIQLFWYGCHSFTSFVAHTFMLLGSDLSFILVSYYFLQ